MLVKMAALAASHTAAQPTCHAFRRPSKPQVIGKSLLIKRHAMQSDSDKKRPPPSVPKEPTSGKQPGSSAPATDKQGGASNSNGPAGTKQGAYHTARPTAHSDRQVRKRLAASPNGTTKGPLTIGPLKGGPQGPQQGPMVELAKGDAYWAWVLVLKTLLITLTLGYGGIGLVWELRGVDVSALTAWDKASAALLVESVQLLLVAWVVRAAARQKGVEATGGLVRYRLSPEALLLGGTGALATFISNAFLSTISALLLAALLAPLVGGEATNTTLTMVQQTVKAHDTEVAMVLTAGDGLAAAAMIAAAGVFAPLVEEIVYRGLLLPTLLARLPTWAAVLVSAAVFAASHLSPSRFAQLLVLGIVLGTLRAGSEGGDLAPCTAAHMLYNGAILSAMLRATW